MLQQEVKNVTKDRLVETLGKIQSGADPGYYHDEIETVIGLLMDCVTQEDVDKAYAEIREDKVEE